MARLASLDPATGETVGDVEVASRQAVADAVAAARGAQVAWAATPAKDRAAVFARFRRILTDRRDEAARLVTRESGKPAVEAMMADVLTTLETAKHIERRGPKVMAATRVRLHNPILVGRTSRVERHPVGVVAVVAPWNYPLAIPATGVLTALMAGNGAVLKPSEKTPLVGAWFVARLREALAASGAPDGLVGVVQGAGDVGATLVASDVDAVLFTGSVATGKKVAGLCAPRLAATVLELGGKDPMVVLPGARRETTLRGAVWGAFTNAGQTCAAVERLYVPAAEDTVWRGALRGAAMALRVGNGLDAGVDMGPLIDDDAVRRVRAQVRDAEKRGATVLCGGDVRDDLGPRFFAPTVLADVDHGMAVMRDETFGPLLPMMTYDGTRADTAGTGDAVSATADADHAAGATADDALRATADDAAGMAAEDEAVRLANDSDYGLCASVWGPRAAARRVAARLDAGTVMVNECVYTYAAPETPWGGWKDSGTGTSHGRWGFDAVTRLRHMHEASGKAVSAWHFPYDERLASFLDAGIRFLHDGGVARAGRGVKALRDWRGRRRS